MSQTIRSRLIEQFADKEYRHSYVASFFDTLIAAQLRALRKEGGLTQKELAKRTGTQQSGISAFERDDYSKWSIPTLRKFASEFDVGLVFKFVRFSEILDQVDRFTRDDVFVVPYDKDELTAIELGVPTASTTPRKKYEITVRERESLELCECDVDGTRRDCLELIPTSPHVCDDENGFSVACTCCGLIVGGWSSREYATQGWNERLRRFKS